VIQGYSAMALVDAKHQVIVHAQAFGENQEHGLLIPMLEGACESYRDLKLSQDVLEGVKLSADTGLHSEANLKYLCERHIDGYVADTFFRKRDIRFAGAQRYKPPAGVDAGARFGPREFRFADDLSH